MILKCIIRTPFFEDNRHVGYRLQEGHFNTEELSFDPTDKINGRHIKFKNLHSFEKNCMQVKENDLLVRAKIFDEIQFG